MAKLLLIDDESAVRHLLETLFSNTHECDTADRAEQALELLEYQRYDVVITDISMPGLGGVEVLRQINKRHNMTPVIVISGRADEYRELLIEMDVFACFSKPFPLTEIEDAVNRAVALQQQMVPGPVSSQSYDSSIS